MQNWLHDHEFLASWGSAIFGAVAAVLALVGMLVQSNRTAQPLNWNLVTMRVAFLLIISAVISPHADTAMRSYLSMPLIFLLIAIFRTA
jgi:uncharacterized membrane protein